MCVCVHLTTSIRPQGNTLERQTADLELWITTHAAPINEHLETKLWLNDNTHEKPTTYYITTHWLRRVTIALLYVTINKLRFSVSCLCYVHDVHPSVTLVDYDNSATKSGNRHITLTLTLWPSVLWRCWLSSRKGIWPVKIVSGGMLAWLFVWGEVQICIWPSGCHCHSLSLAPVNPDWFTFLVYLSGTGSPW